MIYLGPKQVKSTLTNMYYYRGKKQTESIQAYIYLCTSRTGRLHSTAGRGAVGSSDLARARAVDMPSVGSSRHFAGPSAAASTPSAASAAMPGPANA